MSSAHDLLVWHRAVAFAAAVTGMVRRLPRDAMPGMRSQLARSAASIPANIAEGTAHESPAQFAHYVTVAMGSCAEVESHLLLIEQAVRDELGVQPLLVEVVEIRCMLGGLRRYLRARIAETREGRSSRRT